MNKHPYTAAIGNKIREARMKRGLTVRALATICSMDYANFSRIENGYQNILVLTLKNIADALEIDIKEFI